MKHKTPADVLRMLNGIPKNMIQMHGTENMSEFVLHSLCCSDCFNLRKAAYFVDNPAFDCLKGIVGFDQNESFNPTTNIWSNSEAFTKHMYDSPFNQKVRNCLQYSCKNCDTPDQHLMENIARDLGMDSFDYCTWSMKHDNHGYLIYQKSDENHEHQHEDLLNGLCLLSFCPIF